MLQQGAWSKKGKRKCSKSSSCRMRWRRRFRGPDHSGLVLISGAQPSFQQKSKNSDRRTQTQKEAKRAFKILTLRSSFEPSACRSPPSTRDRLLFVVTVDFPGTQSSHSAREPSRHCEHSEQGEPSDSQLSPHASLISKQRSFMVMWQLKATLPCSQSSRSPALVIPGFLGNLASACLLNQETDHQFVQLHLLLPKGAHQSAHTPCAFFAEAKGLDGTSFETATGSCLTRKKRGSPCGPYFPGTFQQEDAVRRRTLSRWSKQGQTPSQ